eukprot:4648502-Pyramimonas_sp.AAC.1
MSSGTYPEGSLGASGSGGPPVPPIPRDDFELERKRKFLVDDVPSCIKRSRLQAAPTSGLPALREVAMNAV